MIKIILAVGLIAALFLYIRYLKSRLLSKLVIVSLFLLGLVFVFIPDLTNYLAHLVGVGRGADLLLYCMTILFYLSFIYNHYKIKAMQEQITGIIRYGAIDHVKEITPTTIEV
jgi:small membrane protein